MKNKDFQNGYILGVASGGVVEVVDTTEMDAIEDLIDNSGVLEDTEGSVSEKVEQLIEKAEMENVWYTFTEGINQTYSYLFRSIQSETMPRINPINVPNISNWWSYNTYLKRIDFYINTESCTNTNRAFQNATALEYIKGIYTKKSINIQAMFHKCGVLHTIEEPLDFSSVINNDSARQCFDYCGALVNVSFVKESIKVSISFSASPLLSAESIQSIAYGLAYVTTAQTLTLNKVFENDFERLPAELRDLITNQKGWTLAFAS
jgi:hypothetical protein